MAITGIFSRARPAIAGIFFDATLEESDELQTDVTRYPVENGSEGNDHAVNRNLRITMTVALSDNPARTLTAESSQGDALGMLANLNLPPGIVRAGVGIGVGQIARVLSGGAAAIAGIGASVGVSGSGRSSSVLEQIRDMQRRRDLFDLITSKGAYSGCLITNTRRSTNPRNEQGLELVVEIEQLQIMYSARRPRGVVAPTDPAAAQAFPLHERGEIRARPLP